tara:strand:- start:3760 stop:3999 length:240 start_codon:yes stop_codon:yes gene_type:complete
MESKKSKEAAINAMSDKDKDSLKYITDKLEKVIESSEITENSTSELENIVVELLGMQNRHQHLLRRWIKQGYISDQASY